MKLFKFNRDLHRWASILIALPMLIVVVSGLILQLKKEIPWIQPATLVGSRGELILDFDNILEISKSVPEALVGSWGDVDRLDVRPGKGVLKVRCKNQWEIQIDTKSGNILQVAHRRSDLIESIHDGSFFDDSFRLWVFLPAGVILLIVWATGIYLFIHPYLAKHRK